jgi:hypothetical protein
MLRKVEHRAHPAIELPFFYRAPGPNNICNVALPPLTFCFHLRLLSSTQKPLQPQEKYPLTIYRKELIISRGETNGKIDRGEQ